MAERARNMTYNVNVNDLFHIPYLGLFLEQSSCLTQGYFWNNVGKTVPLKQHFGTKSNSKIARFLYNEVSRDAFCALLQDSAQHKMLTYQHSTHIIDYILFRWRQRRIYSSKHILRQTYKPRLNVKHVKPCLKCVKPCVEALDGTWETALWQQYRVPVGCQVLLRNLVYQKSYDVVRDKPKNGRPVAI